MSALDVLKRALKEHNRIAIVGGSGTGKTTLSQHITDRAVIHADDFIPSGWSQASHDLAARVNELPGPLVVEGVAVPRALRKGMRVDFVLVLTRKHRQQTEGQQTQEKGMYTVFDEWCRDNPKMPIYTVW